MEEFLHIYQPGFTDEPGSYMSPIIDITPILPTLGSIVYNGFDGKSFVVSEYFILDEDQRDIYCGNLDEDDLEDVKLCVYYYEVKENPDFTSIIRDLKLKGIGV